MPFRLPSTTSLALLLTATVLGGCGDKIQSGESIPTPVIVESNAHVDIKQQTSDKLNRYTQAFNQLTDTLGLDETFKAYRAQNVPQASASDALSVSDGWITTALDGLKRARSAPGAGLSDLDRRADTLIAALGTLSDQLKDLEIYYKTRAYVADGLARGKAEHASLMSHFEASQAAAESFDAVLSTHQHARAQARIDQFKASGDMLRYESALAIEQAAPLFKLFRDAADFHDPDRLAQADVQVAELEQTLARQRQQLVNAPASPGSAAAGTEGTYAQLGTHLGSMIGSYRQMKKSGDASAFGAMVKDYNSAISNANDLVQ